MSERCLYCKQRYTVSVLYIKEIPVFPIYPSHNSFISQNSPAHTSTHLPSHTSQSPKSNPTISTPPSLPFLPLSHPTAPLNPQIPLPPLRPPSTDLILPSNPQTLTSPTPSNAAKNPTPRPPKLRLPNSNLQKLRPTKRRPGLRGTKPGIRTQPHGYTPALDAREGGRSGYRACVGVQVRGAGGREGGRGGGFLGEGVLVVL